MACLCPTSHRGSFLTMEALLLLYIVFCVGVSGNSALQSNNLLTYIHNGTICVKCPPGHFVYKHCSQKFNQSECEACPKNMFQTEYTQAESCEDCLPHCPDKNMNIIQNCTATTNLKCKCKDGYFLFSDKHAGESCHRHTPCPQGQVVVKQGTSESEQECGECEEGTFYKHGQCEPCTQCGNGTVLTACSRTRDATCQGAGNTTGDGKSEHGSAQRHYVVPTVLTILLVVVVALALLAGLVYRKYKKQSSSVPLLDMPTVNRRQRTFSGSSYKSVDTQEETEYPNLKDPTKWKSEVFRWLSHRLGSNWKAVIRALPGSEDYKATIDASCDHICDEYRQVKEQIYQALRKWAEENDPEDVIVDNIISTLNRTDGCKTLAEDLHKFCADLNLKAASTSSPEPV